MSMPRVFRTSHPRLQATPTSLSLSYLFLTDSMVEPSLPLTKVLATERPYLVAILASIPTSSYLVTKSRLLKSLPSARQRGRTRRPRRPSREGSK